MEERRVTLKDVAQAVGVSVSTVSLVLNGVQKSRISEGTRAKVIQAADQLGYRPNILAKGLVRGHSKLIGVITDGVATTPFAGRMIRGAQEVAWANGFMLLIADTEGNPQVEQKALDMMHDYRAAGIIYATWYHRRVHGPEVLNKGHAVFVNCFPAVSGGFSVVPHERQGGSSATQILIKGGHSRIAFINSSEDAPATVGRLRGYRDALRAAGIPYDEDLVITMYPEREGGFQEAGYLAGVELFSRRNRPSAVFCYNDRTAMGVYEAIHSFGLEIPRDVAVVGFDDQQVIATHLRPRLTTVALPHHALGARGMEALIDMITSGQEREGIEALPCPPVIRASA